MAFKHNTSDTADGILTQGEYESTSGHILDSQAAGDMIVADTTTTMTRLAVGSADEVLTSDGSTPTYSKITTSNINASTLVIESEGIGSNDNDTTIPTSAAVKDYVDTNVTAQDLDFTGDSGGPSAVDLDSQTLTISGTANEIETSVSGQTLTVGIVTNPTIGGNLTVTGDLTVNGTTTTVDTTNTVIQDPLIELNTGAASNANDLGIVMERGSTGDNAIIAWDESADGFIVGTTTATGASTGDLTIAAAPLTASTLTSDVITVDTINETTADGGVTIDSVLLKDNVVTSSKIVARTASSGQTVDPNADEGLFEGSGNSGISILSGATSYGNIFFGDSGADNIGIIRYDHTNDRIETLINGQNPLNLTAGLVYVSDGQGLVVGHTGQVTVAGNVPEFQVHGTGGADTRSVLARWDNGAGGPIYNFVKSRSGTIGSFGSVADNDILGQVSWYADDGTDLATEAARIQVLVDGTPGSNNIPSEMIFSTNAGAGTPTEALRIDSNQNTLIANGNGLVVGHTAQLTIDGLVPEVQVLGTADGVDSALALGGFGTGIEPRLILAKARGTIGSPSAGQNGDNHGEILWIGHDGTDFQNTKLARIYAFSDGSSIADTNSAGALVFETTANGSGTPTEALRIDRSQMVKVAAGSGTTIPTNGQYWWADINGDMHLSSQGALLVDIDTNANNSDKTFAVRANAGTTSLFQVDEAGLAAIGDTANANMTVGLTINQGGNDNELIAGKSSDIAHGYTAGAETDTWFNIKKRNGAVGGMQINAFGETASDITMEFNAYGHAANTAKNTTGFGGFNFILRDHDGANNLANIDANGNVFSIRARVGGSDVTRFLIDEDGDMYSVTAGQTFDDYDDLVALDYYDKVRSGEISPKDAIKASYGKYAEYNEQALIEMGVLGDTIANGGLTNQSQLSRLLTGGVRKLAEEVKSLKAEIKALTEGR